MYMKDLEKKYVAELQKLHDSIDEEKAHVIADGLLCDFLKELGYSDVVKAFDKVPKY